MRLLAGSMGAADRSVNSARTTPTRLARRETTLTVHMQIARF